MPKKGFKMSSIGEIIYDMNHILSTKLSKIPGVGDEIISMQKVLCDYVFDPLVINGTHAGCDAINDIYRSLEGKETGGLER